MQKEKYPLYQISSEGNDIVRNERNHLIAEGTLLFRASLVNLQRETFMYCVLQLRGSSLRQLDVKPAA